MCGMSTRLPDLQPTTDQGVIYVSKQGDAYKVGFTRKGLKRRVRDSGGILVLTIPTGQAPSVLEYIINRRFAAKRLPDYKDNDGGKREWFALDAADLVWLRGLAQFISDPQDRVEIEGHPKPLQVAL
jgi:hypothetical protein